MDGFNAARRGTGAFFFPGIFAILALCRTLHFQPSRIFQVLAFIYFSRPTGHHSP
jgi:hypothetical protein